MRLRPLLAGLCLAGLTAPAPAAIQFLGQAAVPGSSSDLSGLTDLLEDGTPHDRLGGFGSGLAYTGVGNRFLATPDRGPADGATRYLDRFQSFDIVVTPTGTGYSVSATLVGTTLMRTETGAALTGNAGAFGPAGLRFDPEGVRVARNGHAFVSDEYGPHVYEFDATGARLRTLAVPGKFAVARPSSAAGELPPNNAAGRQANRGMEGLAISPDGGKFYGILQNALLQDGALDAAGKRVGLNNRLVEFDLVSGATREFVYTLEDKAFGVNEILAVNDHQFLVLERDGNGLGGNGVAAFKRLYLIDLEGLRTSPKWTAPRTSQAWTACRRRACRAA